MRRRSALQCGWAQTGDIDAVEPHLPAVGFVQAQNGAAQCRLAATALADQAEGFAALDRQADAVHGLHVALVAGRAAAGAGRADWEVLDEVCRTSQQRIVMPRLQPARSGPCGRRP